MVKNLNSLERNFSIAVLDSGFGGLTVLSPLRRLLPRERIIYLGDTARLPYGDKSRETIRAYAAESARFLIDQDVKLLIVACHTASTAALDYLRETLSIPVIGISEQGIEELALRPHLRRVAILGTRATIASGVYQKQLRERLPAVEVTAVACSLFVPLVEEGYLDHPMTTLAVKEYLRPLRKKQMQALLLGCTHYPLLEPLMRREMGDAVQLIDPGFRCAQTAQKLLSEKELLSDEKTAGDCTFFVTDDPEKFRRIGERFLGCPIENVYQAMGIST